MKSPVQFFQRFLYRLMAGFCCLYPLVAESTSPTPDEPVTVRVFELPTKHGSAPPQIAAYRVVERFLELHPEIRLEASTTLKIEGMNMDAAPLMAIAGGTSPDIIYVNFRQSDTYISQGFLYPLDEYVATMSKQEFADRVPDPVLPVIYRDGPKGKHYWMMPQHALATVLMYRRDLFAAAGLDPDRPPQNWKELREFAEKVADPSKGIYGLAFYMGPNASWGIYSFLCSAGAQAIKQLPNGEWKACFDSDEAVTAYQFADELQKEKTTRNGMSGPIAYRGVGEDVGEKWRGGRLAMMFGSLGVGKLADFDDWNPELVNPELIGVAPIPVGPTGKSSAEINCRMAGIFAGQKDKRIRDAAWKYIHFVDSNEAHRIFTQTMVEQGATRMISPTWMRKFGFPELAKLAPPGLEETIETALLRGTPEPYGKNCQFVYSMMSKPIDQIYFTDFRGRTDSQIRAKIKEYLTAAVREADEKMLGIIPEPIRQKRNKVAWVVAILVATSFILLLRKVFSWINASRPPVMKSGPDYKTRLAAMLIAPALFLILMWQYYPLSRGSLMAFQNYNVMGGSPWVGISNFADVLFDERFWLSLKNAFYFCTLWMTMGFLPPLFLAIMLQEIPVGKIFYRVVFYLPAVVSGVVILFMWRAIYDPSDAGILNRILVFFHLPPQRWIHDPRLAMFCVVFPMAWAQLGPGCIIYLAALKGIPDELYEAADIDGASFFNKLRYIVLPYLKPLLVINAVGATIVGFKSGDVILAMTGGGPNMATHVIGYEIFERTFLFLKFGLGTAMAWIVGILLMSFAAYQLKVLNRVEFRTANR